MEVLADVPKKPVPPMSYSTTSVYKDERQWFKSTKFSIEKYKARVETTYVTQCEGMIDKAWIFFLLTQMTARRCYQGKMWFSITFLSPNSMVMGKCWK